MRFRTKFALILLILSSLILSVLIYDSNEHTQYDNPTNLQKIAITFHEDSLTAEDFIKIIQELNSYGFLLERRIIKQDNVDQESTTHYFSFASMEEYNSLNIDINATDFLENNKHEYKLLSTYLSDNPLYGSYFLYYTNETELNNFISYLDQTIPNTYHLTVVRADTPLRLYSSLLIVILLVLISLITVFLLFDLLDHSKKLAINKLFGFSAYEIAATYIKEISKYYASFFVVTLLISIPFIGLHLLFILRFIFLHIIIYTTITLVILFTSQFVFSKINLSHLLKNMRITTIIHVLNFSLKVIVIFILFQSLPFAINEYVNGQRTLSKYDSFTNNDLMVIRDFNVGDDISSLAGEDTLDRAAIDLYKELNHDGKAIYADFYAFMPEAQLDNTSVLDTNQYIVATVDTTYLREYGLLSEESIREIESNQALTLLVPEFLADKKYELLEHINLYKDENEKIHEHQLVYYQDRTIPSLNPRVATDNSFSINSPLMLVFHESNIDQIDLLQAFGNAYSTAMKIINSTSSQAFMDEYAELLQDIHLDDNISQENISTIGDLFLEEISGARQAILLALLLSTISIVFFAIAIMQSTWLYMSENSKKFAVQFMFGYSLLDRLRSFILLHAAIDIIIILINLILSSFKFESLLVAGVILLLSSVLNIVLPNYLLKRNQIKVLKGARI